ncbi:MAG: DegV family protein [Lachnospiraceae bacterium]|nr:DegV family protein [Lachnospiraceae bacterium]
MKYQIVSDSASDLLELADINFSTVPLHIVVDGTDFADDARLSVPNLLDKLRNGKSSTTACPSPDDWITAFHDADRVFCVTITSGLSGSYNSAVIAKDIYEEKHPDRKVYIIDSLATGSKMVMLCEKLRELILAGHDAEEIYRQIKEYNEHCFLYFALASLDNLAKNGRVSPILAKGIKILGIRIVGTASTEGMLEPLSKCRGDRRSIPAIIEFMKEKGYQGGRVVITHNGNHEAAMELKRQLKTTFGTRSGEIHRTRGLCSYYAEPGSIMLAFDLSPVNPV